MSIPSEPQERPAPNIGKLRTALSEERFARYLTAANGDEELAWRLYTWGLDVAAALHLPLHALEITLRNRMHGSIARVHGHSWLTDHQRNRWLRPSEIDMIDKAHAQVRRERRVVTAGDLVAALPFGFWVGLVAAYHDQGLWRQATHRTFSGRPRRRDLHDDLDHIRTLRNRIAHHEHLLNRQLEQDLDRILKLLALLNTEVATWAADQSNARTVIRTRPTPLRAPSVTTNPVRL